MKKYIDPKMNILIFDKQEVLYASVGAEDGNIGGDNLGDNNDFIQKHYYFHNLMEGDRCFYSLSL